MIQRAKQESYCLQTRPAAKPGRKIMAELRILAGDPTAINSANLTLSHQLWFNFAQARMINGKRKNPLLTPPQFRGKPRFTVAQMRCKLRGL